MRHLLTILTTLLLTLSASAQVKGHEYFCWQGTLGKDIRCEVRMEHDNDQLALGEIIYFRKNGKVSSIPLYGTIKQTGKGLNVTLYEYLPSGKNTGVLNLTISNGDIPYAAWNSPDNTTRLNFNIKETKEFPYAEVQTYFHPLKDNEAADGVYISTNRFPATTTAFSRLELNRINDNTYALNFAIPENDFSRLLTFNKVSHNRLNLQKDMGVKTNIEVRLFEDFTFVYIISDPENSFRQAGELSNFYMLKPDEKVINWPLYYDEGYQNLSAARLADGKVSIYNNPDLVVAIGALQQDDIMAAKGWVDLRGIKSGIKDILIGDIGQDTNPVLAILNEDGTVQILTLMISAPKGWHTVSEPLHNLKDIVKLSFSKPENKEFIDYSTIWAMDKEGKYHEISVCPTCQIGSDWEIEDPTKDNHYNSWICLTPEWRIDYHHETMDGKGNSEIENFYGSFWNTDDEMENYEYHFTSKNKSVEKFENKDCDIKGTFKIEIQYGDDGYYLNITPISDDQFCVPKGKTGKFKYIHVVG